MRFGGIQPPLAALHRREVGGDESTHFFKARSVSRGGRIRTAGPQVAEQRGEAVIADERGVADVAPICKT